MTLHTAVFAVDSLDVYIYILVIIKEPSQHTYIGSFPHKPQILLLGITAFGVLYSVKDGAQIHT